jgi:aspartyl-tRNA(Asn)/glutamyl-tRNA(Gln) amidotransferase subunit A
VCDRRYDEALAEARASADRYAGTGGAPRPLDGLPVAAKEEHPMAGRSYSMGSLIYQDLVADETHPIIERIQAAGGIVHIRTTTPEFCCAGFTHSHIWGITRNPWNPDYSPGGSSGGSGAALAAGYSPLATGSDIGGSIRMPASFCGVVGFKPPYGRVPAMPPFNLDQYCHDGPMAATVADCALLSNVISGRHPHDIVSLPDPPQLPPSGSGVAGLRIALCLRLGDFPIEPEVERNTRSVAAALEAAGATVVEVELPWDMASFDAAAKAHFAAIFGSSVGAELDAHADLLTPYAKVFARMKAPNMNFLQGLEVEGRLYRALGDVLHQYDAMLCPTMGTRGFPVGEDYVDSSCVVDGVTLPDYLLAALTLPFNLFSRCPVLAVPSGLADNGVPPGGQVVGRTYDDLTTFRIGYAIEAAAGGFARPPLP